jgi:1,4-dihydroxy-2-naphthoate octaprenyltransferase
MDPIHSMLIPILAGMLLLCVGYSYQERDAGVFVLWLGILCILGTVGYKILEKLT